MLHKKKNDNLVVCFSSKISLYFQVMTSRQRSDLHVDLPALRKLDKMLLVRYSLYFMVFFFVLIVTIFFEEMNSYEQDT